MTQGSAMTHPVYQKQSCAPGIPWLQTAWDSSSLATYLRCPRRYFYQYVCGYRPHGESVDLTFGTLIHTALEVYHLERMSRGHAEAQVRGLQALLSAAWNQGKEGEDGTTVPSGYWISDSNNKNFWNCIRAFIWHTEQFAYEPDFNTTLVGNKLTAIELPFSFDLEIAINGYQASYCGHLDRMVDTASGRWVVDYKSTKKTINSQYFDSYNLATQLPGYAVAAKIVFGEPVQGVIVDALQIGVDFVRCGRGHILLGEERADEWLHNATSWVEDAMLSASRAKIEPAETIHDFAQANAHNWRLNTESCFICPFKEVCKATPSVRKFILESSFRIEHWDPLARQSKTAQKIVEAGLASGNCTCEIEMATFRIKGEPCAHCGKEIS